MITHIRKCPGVHKLVSLGLPTFIKCRYKCKVRLLAPLYAVNVLLPVQQEASSQQETLEERIQFPSSQNVPHKQAIRHFPGYLRVTQSSSLECLAKIKKTKLTDFPSCFIVKL